MEFFAICYEDVYLLFFVGGFLVGFCEGFWGFGFDVLQCGLAEELEGFFVGCVGAACGDFLRF